MIRIIRPVEPVVLTNNKKEWTRVYLTAREVYNVTPTPNNKRAKASAESKYNHISVKEALLMACNSKCVYCESHITHIAYPHIEHFKPKAKFPKLCFEWKNLFLGCTICNGPTYKSDKWPTSSKGGPFINPETENPNTFFNFIFDEKTGVSLVHPKGKRARTTEKELGLNRIELLKHRNPVVKKLAYIALQASKGDKAALAELKFCMEPDQEYSAFARSFFRKFKLKMK
ncbi:hypothetical protein A4D02_06555 [Niastella koreensis]|uniref:TIGR02646 family protein n=2 Tax=Niastella koreensis TaxID=354356 RepID=G8TG57_NIAKG|nr:hypothetical protein [Niastella koreensis]AEW01660.1 hypothetical protein Niako_5423 [Niastella koreensis GR20-10]OQP48371.1 hypothetical protein A4D02_06555 [Niastella koreensis]